MNWKRGLFRIWVICSILWALAVVGIGGAIPAVKISAQPIQQTSAGPSDAELVKACLAEVAKDKSWGSPSSCYESNSLALKMTIMDSAINATPKPDKQNPDAVSQDVHNEAVETITSCAAAIIAVPVLMLLLGMAALWALSGFARSVEKSSLR